VKCGSPLEAETESVENTAPGFEVHGHGGDSGGLKRTVLESEVFGQQDERMPMSMYGPPAMDFPGQDSPHEDDEQANCPKCGYPIRPDTVKCPNCGYLLAGQHVQQPSKPIRLQDSSGYERRPTRLDVEPEQEAMKKTRTSEHQPTRRINGGGANSRQFRGTVNPYMMDFQAEPVFVLTPIKRINERKPTEAIELEGSEVVLTRDNTEPGNPSITSGDQAVVTHVDGRWYIEDLSEQKTTFVQAGHKIELHDGDIILLGNRLFEFKEQA